MISHSSVFLNFYLYVSNWITYLRKWCLKMQVSINNRIKLRLFILPQLIVNPTNLFIEQLSSINIWDLQIMCTRIV